MARSEAPKLCGERQAQCFWGRVGSRAAAAPAEQLSRRLCKSKVLAVDTPLPATRRQGPAGVKLSPNDTRTAWVVREVSRAGRAQ